MQVLKLWYRNASQKFLCVINYCTKCTVDSGQCTMYMDWTLRPPSPNEEKQLCKSEERRTNVTCHGGRPATSWRCCGPLTPGGPVASSSPAYPSIPHHLQYHYFNKKTQKNHATSTNKSSWRCCGPLNPGGPVASSSPAYPSIRHHLYPQQHYFRKRAKSHAISTNKSLSR
jgi:hypothetical protein